MKSVAELTENKYMMSAASIVDCQQRNTTF
jgi:hypothetical protein